MGGCREAADGKEAILEAIEDEVDIAVLDYSLPLVKASRRCVKFTGYCRELKGSIFTMHDNDALIEDALKAGARGYLLKSEAKRNLIAAIEALASHKKAALRRSRRFGRGEHCCSPF